MASSFKNYSSNGITDNTETTVITCPADTTLTVVGMTVANTSGNDTYVTVKVNDTKLIYNVQFGAGDSIVPIGGEQKVVLTPNDELKVIADNTVDVFVSVLESK